MTKQSHFVSYVGLDPFPAQNGGFRGGENEPAGCICCPLPPPHIPSAKLPVSITSHRSLSQLLSPQGQVRICINVRGGQVQCEFLHVMLLMTCSLTQRVSPVYFSCSSVKRIPPVYQLHLERTADRESLFF